MRRILVKCKYGKYIMVYQYAPYADQWPPGQFSDSQALHQILSRWDVGTEYEVHFSDTESTESPGMVLHED